MEVLEAKKVIPTVHVNQLDYIDQQIARQIRDKAEPVYGETSHFSIDPIRLKNGYRIEADISIHYREEEPYNVEFSPEEEEFEISTIDPIVYLKDIEAYIMDGEDGYPVQLRTNRTEVEILNLI